MIINLYGGYRFMVLIKMFVIEIIRLDDKVVVNCGKVFYFFIDDYNDIYY